MACTYKECFNLRILRENIFRLFAVGDMVDISTRLVKEFKARFEHKMGLNSVYFWYCLFI